ncbi:MAG: DUF3343 domain-containing protein [Oscillospiraceae bacterium]
MDEILFVFDRTGEAIAAEQTLLAAGLAIRVMSLPSAIQAGCGICLRVPKAQVRQAQALLLGQRLSACALYVRILGEKGNSTYIPYREENP